jgi:hypothetical protein
MPDNQGGKRAHLKNEEKPLYLSLFDSAVRDKRSTFSINVSQGM